MLGTMKLGVRGAIRGSLLSWGTVLSFLGCSGYAVFSLPCIRYTGNSASGVGSALLWVYCSLYTVYGQSVPLTGDDATLHWVRSVL